MGNCNEAREYDDVVTDTNDDKDEVEEALQTEKQILKLKHGSVIDPLYAHIKDCIPENVIFSENEKRFKKLYRIKKNLHSEKNFLYDLKVLEQKKSGQYFNAKMITKERILLIGEDYFRTMLKNELRSLSLLNENSCEILLKIYLLKNKNSFKLIIISNYCEPKSLLDIINEHIEKKQKFTDKEIASVGKQLILTAYRLKSLNIIHRNISPDNIYFIKSSNLKSLSLRNFYFSTQLGKTKSTNGVYGGLWYMSPEMIKDLKYDFKTDMWSIGIILYIMMTLENPFIHCESRENMIDKLKSKKLFMSQKELRFLGIDEDIVSLVYKILVENPTIRCGSEILLDEEIFKNNNLIEYKITKKEIYNYINYSDAFVEEFYLKTLKKESGLLLHALNYYLIFNLRNLFLY
jgi:serine/threonine protein kinase